MVQITSAVNVANGVAFDVPNDILPVERMEVLTNQNNPNHCFMSQLNDFRIKYYLFTVVLSVYKIEDPTRFRKEL